MKLLKAAGLSAAVIGLGLVSLEVGLRVKYANEWKRFGEKMSLISDEKFREERKDVANALRLGPETYVNEYGYGIEMPRNENQEEHFKKYGVELISIKTKMGDVLSELAYILYRDSSEWMNFKLLNPKIAHYNPNAPLPNGLEIKAYMLPGQISQYLADFPDRSVEISKNN